MVSIRKFREVTEGKGLVISDEQWDAAERALAKVDPRITEAEADTVSIHEAGHALLSLLTGRMPRVIWSSPYTHQVGAILGFRNMGMVHSGSESLTPIQTPTSGKDAYKKSLRFQSDEYCLDEILTYAAGSVAQSILSEVKTDSTHFFERHGSGDREYIDLALDVLLERLHKDTYGTIGSQSKADVRSWVLEQISKSLYEFISWGAEDLCGRLLDQITARCRASIIMVGNDVDREINDSLRTIGDGDEIEVVMEDLTNAYRDFRKSLLEVIRTPGVFAFALVDLGEKL